MKGFFDMTPLSNPCWGPASGAKAKQLVVLCHGTDADGGELIELAPIFADARPDALFLAPDAPDCAEPARLGAGVRCAAGALDGLIDAELARLEISDYAMVGFGEGAMTALFSGLRRAKGPKAIVSFAGALVDPESLAADLKCRPPVLLAHGVEDYIVQPYRAREAERVLRAAGVPAKVVFEPEMGHGIGQVGLAAAADLLARVFA